MLSHLGLDVGIVAGAVALVAETAPNIDPLSNGPAYAASVTMGGLVVYLLRVSMPAMQASHEKAIEILKTSQREAIAELRQHCQDELKRYQEVIEHIQEDRRAITESINGNAEAIKHITDFLQTWTLRQRAPRSSRGAGGPPTPTE